MPCYHRVPPPEGRQNKLAQNTKHITTSEIRLRWGLRKISSSWTISAVDSDPELQSPRSLGIY